MAAHPSRRSRLPILDGVLPLDPAGVRTDVIAGATLAALAIPEVMGYTKIAGTPVITGLYTILLPVLAFAIFGSSRHLVIGADSATAAILATGLIALGETTGSAEYVALASLAALLCAAVLLVGRLLRLGFVANFLSRSVLVGFLTGVGIQVALGQVGGMLGISGESGRSLQAFAETLQAIPEHGSLPSLALSLATIGVVVGLERLDRRIPGALVAVVGSIALGLAVDLPAHGIQVVGPVPGGLPALGLPTSVMTADRVVALAPTVGSMVIVILAQSAATARAYAMKYGDSFDEDVDLVGLGLANAAAGISGTFPVNGSPTKTEMVDSAGGRSQVAQLTCAAVVVAVLLFLSGPLASLPTAVLAAIVFLIGLRLVDLVGLTAIARIRTGEAAVAIVTAATVVVVGVEQGILLAIGLSILEHISHSYRPYDALVSRHHGRLRLEPLDSGARLVPGVVA